MRPISRLKDGGSGIEATKSRLSSVSIHPAGARDQVGNDPFGLRRVGEVGRECLNALRSVPGLHSKLRLRLLIRSLKENKGRK